MNYIDEVRTVLVSYFSSQKSDFWKRRLAHLPTSWKNILEIEGCYNLDYENTFPSILKKIKLEKPRYFWDDTTRHFNIHTKNLEYICLVYAGSFKEFLIFLLHYYYLFFVLMRLVQFVLFSFYTVFDTKSIACTHLRSLCFFLCFFLYMFTMKWNRFSNNFIYNYFRSTI